MLNYNSPIMDIKDYSEIKISEVEPIIKINLRGKNKDFITKIGKKLKGQKMFVPMENKNIIVTITDTVFFDKENKRLNA